MPPQDDARAASAGVIRRQNLPYLVQIGGPITALPQLRDNERPHIYVS